MNYPRVLLYLLVPSPFLPLLSSLQRRLLEHVFSFPRPVVFSHHVNFINVSAFLPSWRRRGFRAITFIRDPVGEEGNGTRARARGQFAALGLSQVLTKQGGYQPA